MIFIASCYASLSHSIEECVSPLYFSNLTSDILYVWHSLTERFSHFDKTPEIAWRGLIYRDTFRDCFRNRPMLTRHLYDSTPTFDYSTLQASAGVAPATFLAEFTLWLLFAQPIFPLAGIPHSVSLFLVSTWLDLVCRS